MKRDDQHFRRDLLSLLTTEPFEPFRLKLVNGDHYDIFYPQNVVVSKAVVSIHAPDQNWAFFPIDKIASIESLIADFHGEAARHSPPSS